MRKDRIQFSKTCATSSAVCICKIRQIQSIPIIFATKLKFEAAKIMRIGKDNENFLPYMESFWPKSVKSGKDNENPAKIMVAKIMRIDCN